MNLLAHLIYKKVWFEIFVLSNEINGFFSHGCNVGTPGNSISLQYAHVCLFYADHLQKGRNYSFTK